MSAKYTVPIGHTHPHKPCPYQMNRKPLTQLSIAGYDIALSGTI